MDLSYILHILIALFFFTLGCCLSQVSVIQFNSEWNADNNFDISLLEDCEVSTIIICDYPELQKKYGIKYVPTIIVFNDSIEIIRFEANIMMKLKTTKGEIQEEIDKLCLVKFE